MQQSPLFLLLFPQFPFQREDLFLKISEIKLEFIKLVLKGLVAASRSSCNAKVHRFRSGASTHGGSLGPSRLHGLRFDDIEPLELCVEFLNQASLVWV